MFIEIHGIKKAFGQGDSRVQVLKGIDLSLNQGEFCVLLGPSGSGKSTLLNIIGGIDTADSGDICIGGEHRSSMKEKQLTRYRRKHLGYIFQMYNLIPNLTVRENIEVGAYLSDRPLKVDELMKTLGLYEHRDKLPNQLSGGQQQRCSIGRAGLQHLQGDPQAHRDGESEVRQHGHHGDPQRGDPAHGGPCGAPAGRHDPGQQPERKQASGRSARMVRSGR